MSSLVQLLAEKRRPLTDGMPGRAMRVDYEYVRQGTASVFHVYGSTCEGGVKFRYVRDAQQWIGQQEVKVILDEVYPDAERVRIDM